jgi:hypothetical protein
VSRRDDWKANRRQFYKDHTPQERGPRKLKGLQLTKSQRAKLEEAECMYEVVRILMAVQEALGGCSWMDVNQKESFDILLANLERRLRQEGLNLTGKE